LSVESEEEEKFVCKREVVWKYLLFLTCNFESAVIINAEVFLISLKYVVPAVENSTAQHHPLSYNKFLVIFMKKAFSFPLIQNSNLLLERGGIYFI
jgi:hypothetical protein